MTGKFIQNYKIVSHLGEGGMGTVYLATDIVLDRPVALKMLHTPLLNQSQFLERFKKEARVLAQLLHPNIAVIYNFIEQDGNHYMVMEYVEGYNLDAFQRKQGSLNTQLVVPVFLQALEGLHHAHKKGIYHRDIKPSNLILTPDGTVKLMDFGIARIAGEQRLTQVNRVVGTVEYMAPELIQGKDPSVASDIYATGVTMYELLTGSLPFKSDTDFNLMQDILKKKPVTVDQLNKNIPRNLSQLVMKALEKKPENRYQDARAFQQALNKAFPELKEVSLQSPKNNPVIPETRIQETVAPTRTRLKPTELYIAKDGSLQQSRSLIRQWQQKIANRPPRQIWITAAILLTALMAMLLFLKPDRPHQFASAAKDSTNNSRAVSQNQAVRESVQPGGGIVQPVVQTPIEAITPVTEDNNTKQMTEPKEKKNNSGTEKKTTSSGSTEKSTPAKEEKKPAAEEEEPPPVPDKKPVPADPQPVDRTISIDTRIAVPLYLRAAIDANTAHEGQQLIFSVTSPIKQDGTLIIEKGAVATGRIKNIGNKKMTIVLTDVTAVNGKKLPLEGVELSGRIRDITGSRNYTGTLERGITIHLKL